MKEQPQNQQQYDLNPEEYGFGDWLADFESSDAFQNGDKLIGLNAKVDSMGSSFIVADVQRGDEIISLSPYFNQSATDNPDDLDRTEADEIENDPKEWLVVMSGATNWSEWAWDEL